jgi:hypothetical protein
MFPIRGFHQDFPFVTPAVTRQVERPAMFPECVVMSAHWVRLAPREAARAGRHIAVTLPGDALEMAGARVVRYIHATSGKRLPHLLFSRPRLAESAYQSACDDL